MWNDKRSIMLSKFSVLLFFVLMVAVLATGPWLVRWLVGFSHATLGGTQPWFFATIYVGAVPAATLLISLLRLLGRIEKGEVFVPRNVHSLRIISWSCIAGAGICAISALYYFPWALVAVAAAFMALIVRIVKNMLEQAVALQDEVDHTI